MHNKHYEFRKAKTTYILEQRVSKEFLTFSLISIYVRSGVHVKERTGEPLPSHMVQMEHVNSNMAASIVKILGSTLCTDRARFLSLFYDSEYKRS